MLPYSTQVSLVTGVLPDLFELLHEDATTNIRWFAIETRVEDTKFTFLLIPGTDDAHDVLADISIWMANFKFIMPHKDHPQAQNWSNHRVHSGFYYAFMSIREALARFVYQLEQTGKLVIIGHSLGGAVAYLVGLDLHYNWLWKRDDLAVITLGAPRLGNGPFCYAYHQRLGQQTIRFVNSEDIVPRFPFRLLGYDHVNEERFIGRPRGFLHFLPWFNDINDHYLRSYIDVLKAEDM